MSHQAGRWQRFAERAIAGAIHIMEDPDRCRARPAPVAAARFRSAWRRFSAPPRKECLISKQDWTAFRPAGVRAHMRQAGESADAVCRDESAHETVSTSQGCLYEQSAHSK